MRATLSRCLLLPSQVADPRLLCFVPLGVAHVGEVNLLLLHLLSRLASRQQSSTITLLPTSALEAALSSVAHGASNSTWKAHSKADFAWQQLRFADQQSVRIRGVGSWSALDPADVIFCPSLMSFSSISPLPTLRSAFISLLQQLGAKPFPPPSWNDAIEHKDNVYNTFHPYMLTTKWVTMQDRKPEDVATELLHDVSDGQYRLKGSYSMCGACGATVVVRNGACSELRSHLDRFAESYHQQTVGLQPFIPSLSQSELRFFTVVTGSAASGPGHRFHKTGIIIRTKLKGSSTSNGSDFQAEHYAAVHSHSLACSELVDTLQQKQPDFFEQLYKLGLRCLRFDVGFDPASNRAFLNEFAAAPDAVTWSSLHQQDLLWFVASQTVDSILALSRE